MCIWFFDECLWYEKDATILDHESSPHASSFSLMDIHFNVNHAGIDKLVFNPFKADSCCSGTKSSIVKSFKILFCTFVYLYDFLLPCLDKYWLDKINLSYEINCPIFKVVLNINILELPDVQSFYCKILYIIKYVLNQKDKI